MQDAFAHCEALVRAVDKDRFLSTLFAPADRRAALVSLYAFNLEIARVREAVRDPIAGEIRLQWWSDTLGGAGSGDVEANPVAAALLATVARYALPIDLLRGMLEAHRFDLYGEPMATVADLERYADGVSGHLIRLAARILDPASDCGELATAGGRAHAIAGLMRALPVHAARGQLYLPADLLRRHGDDRLDVLSGDATPPLRAALAELRVLARQHLAGGRELIGTATSAIIPALLPVALVGPTLKAMERPGADPFAPVELAQWRRQWLIWRAARNPRRIFN